MDMGKKGLYMIQSLVFAYIATGILLCLLAFIIYQSNAGMKIANLGVTLTYILASVFAILASTVMATEATDPAGIPVPISLDEDNMRQVVDGIVLDQKNVNDKTIYNLKKEVRTLKKELDRLNEQNNPAQN